MDDFSFDASGMEALTEDLGRASDVFGIEVDQTMVEVGSLLAETAKMVAKQAGSSSIPSTIKSIPGHEVVEVRAGSPDVQLAALWELGNQGKRKRKEFWHPVYGHRKPGALQDRHPFLTKARRICRPMITDMMSATFERALRSLSRGDSK